MERINTMFYNERDVLHCNMFRCENVRGWLYGKLYFADQFVCDTLEVECSNNIELGEYFMIPHIDEFTGQKYIGIENQFGDELSRIVFVNTEFQNGIEIRQNNNNITVGSRINEPNLVTRQFLFNKIYDQMQKNLLQKIRTVITIGYSRNYIDRKDLTNNQAQRR